MFALKCCGDCVVYTLNGAADIAIIKICSSVGVEIRVVKLLVVVVPLLSSQRAAGTAALGLPYSVSLESTSCGSLPVAMSSLHSAK